MTGIHHFAIQVRDLVAAERFYCDVLGLTVIRRWPAPGGGERSVWVATGAPSATFIALEAVASDGPIAAEDPQRASRPGHHLLALGIGRAERATWEARLAAAGVAVTHRTAFTIYFCDSEGNRLGLSHYPDATEAG